MNPGIFYRVTKNPYFSCAEAVGVPGGSEVQVRLNPGDFSDGLDAQQQNRQSG